MKLLPPIKAKEILDHKKHVGFCYFQCLWQMNDLSAS